MHDESAFAGSESEASVGSPGYTPPTFEVIPLDCEITAYAPDGEQPLL